MSKLASALETLLDRIAADGRVDADEVLEIRRTVFPDGVVDRAEAGALFTLAARVANDSPLWTEAFVEALCDHVCGPDAIVDDADGHWFVYQAGKAGALAAPLLVRVMKRADSVPAVVSAAARAAVQTAIGNGPVTAQHVEDVRTCLYAVGGGGAGHVNEIEARWLFEIDAAVDGADNDPAWGDLFVKALLNHVMGHRPSALLDRASQVARRQWLETPHDGTLGNFLARAMSGGPKGWLAHVRAPGEVAAFEAHYAARNAEAEEDARLTLAEVTSLVALVRADGKRTANEERLLGVVRDLEQAGAPSTGA